MEKFNKMFKDNVGNNCVFIVDDSSDPVEEIGILRQSEKNEEHYTVDNMWYILDGSNHDMRNESIKKLKIEKDHITFEIDGSKYDLKFNV